AAPLALTLIPAGIQCSPPPDIPHGRHTGRFMDTFPAGSVVTYTCNSGYARVGESSIYCVTKDGRTGAWSGPPPQCEVKCLQAPNIANGQHSAQASDTFPRGTMVTYHCTDGYTMVGNSSINCTDAGRWSRPLPRCEGG
ncbi:CR2 protein, partial [Crypturellus undulatus]|nr:CR2 protein [Crypturellus undulatus]